MISVCMTTFNGERYVHRQIQSILSQLPSDAELIISDDGSADHTVSIIRSFYDPRIRLIHGPGKGVVANFEHAITAAQGDIIFLSDQDDVWRYDKISKVLDCFNTNNCELVLHDATLVDANMNILSPSFFSYRNVHHGLFQNFIRNSYTGCCMAFRSSIKSKILPFPDKIEMHDWWIGLIEEYSNSSFFLSECLIDYCRHGDNVTTLHHYTIPRMIKNRVLLFFAFYIRMRKLQLNSKMLNISNFH